MNIEDQLAQFLDQTPAVDETAYVAKGAIVIGAVTLAPHSSVWHGAVLRPSPAPAVDLSEYATSSTNGNMILLGCVLEGSDLGRYM